MNTAFIPANHLLKSAFGFCTAVSLCCVCIFVLVSHAHATLDITDNWQLLTSTDGSSATARHEAASVVVGDYLYLIGGRGNRPVERFSTVTGQWENLGLAPIELHHLQPVVIGSDIYVIGAFTCCYPIEPSVATIYVFDTQQLTWDVAGLMPSARVRGSAAAVVHNKRIYVLGGNTQGHDGGAVAWFDEYDPATGQWRELADAPNARDHFSAVIVDQQLVAVAGRQSTLPNPSANAVLQTDIYDFTTGQWRSSAMIPTPRGGAVTVSHGRDVIVAGGEINTANAALSVVEAFDLNSETWYSLPAMSTGRHGSGGGIIDTRFHMVSGASSLGGAVETASHEVLPLPMLAPVQEGASQIGNSSSRRKGGAIDWFLLLALLVVRYGQNLLSQSLQRDNCAVPPDA